MLSIQAWISSSTEHDIRYAYGGPGERIYGERLAIAILAACRRLCRSHEVPVAGCNRGMVGKRDLFMHRPVGRRDFPVRVVDLLEPRAGFGRSIAREVQLIAVPGSAA